MTKISVITAVYNPGSHIEELIDSLLGQTLPADEFEVLFVDDDSTDGTRERLQALAEQHEHIRVFHNTPNSGWPGKPRNIGIDAARGKYVFFVDNDDWLPDDALESLWEFAEANDSDVVMAKEIGQGHTIAWSAFDRTIPRARLGVDPLLRILTPHKLFRRALLDEHGIRFPEGRVRLEDHLFVMKAYFAADVISIYADRTCYHWVRRDASNASSHDADVHAYYHRDLANVLDVVDANVEPGELRMKLYSHWYRLKMLRRFVGPTFHTSTDSDRQAMFDAIHQLTLQRFPESVDAFLDPRERMLSGLLRRGRLDLLVQLGPVNAGMAATSRLTDLGWHGDRLRMAVTATFTHADGTPVRFVADGDTVRIDLPELADADLPPAALDVSAALRRTSLSVLMRDRVTGESIKLPGTAAVELPQGPDGTLTASFTGEVAPTRLPGGNPPPAVVTDVLVRFATAGWGSERRLPYDADIISDEAATGRPAGGQFVRVYPTEGHGNLSIRRTVARRSSRSDPAPHHPWAGRPTRPKPSGSGRSALARTNSVIGKDTVNRHEFLQGLHDVVRPRTYLETGINRGDSITLSRVPSIGIDPEFDIRRELLADVHLARTSSDEFFARRAPLAHLPVPVVDLAFIDGMHLAEYALRDYLAVERFTTPASVIVFDDMLPRSIDEAARYRHTRFWTGDVYKAAQALRDFCPDLIVLEVDTTPTGVAVVLLPNAARNGVIPQYDEWVEQAVSPDPQDVPTEVLERTRAHKPQDLLSSAGWSELVRARGRRGGADAQSIRAAFADVLG